MGPTICVYSADVYSEVRWILVSAQKKKRVLFWFEAWLSTAKLSCDIIISDAQYTVQYTFFFQNMWLPLPIT